MSLGPSYLFQEGGGGRTGRSPVGGERNGLGVVAASVGGTVSGHHQSSSVSHYCSQCPFIGHSPAELKRHLRVHSDEKP